MTSDDKGRALRKKSIKLNNKGRALRKKSDLDADDQLGQLGHRQRMDAQLPSNRRALCDLNFLRKKFLVCSRVRDPICYLRM